MDIGRLPFPVTSYRPDHEEKQLSQVSLEELDISGSSSDQERDAPGQEMQLVSSRKKNLFYGPGKPTDRGNYTFSDDSVMLMQQNFAAANDDPVTMTFHKGKKVTDDPNAPSIEVGIHFIQGADDAIVNADENGAVTKRRPLEVREMWKARTAGDLLLVPEVKQDLSLKRHDRTAEILAKRKSNRKSPAAVTEGLKSSMGLTASPGETVRICSQKVHMLDRESIASGAHSYDLVATCIEVDGPSLMSLLCDFRELIQSQGEHGKLPPEKTVQILETMIEGARRLLARSPILSRAAQRVTIQKSENTRYGFNNGSMFHTFTTSKGIAAMIHQGWGYYSALQTSKDSQRKIRPRFLQMIVFLLSLLNDEDLKELQPVLEKNYELKADRPSMELTIFKVLSYYSVGSYLFLNSVLDAYYQRHEELEDTEYALTEAWETFLCNITKAGWLLPGSISQIGLKDRSQGSWLVKWEKFENSDIFDHVQYSGEKGTVNGIPPLKIYNQVEPVQNVAAEFCNGMKYHLTIRQLDDITNAMEGTYHVKDLASNKKDELIITAEPVFEAIYQAYLRLEQICTKLNETLDAKAQAPRRNRLISRKSSGPSRQLNHIIVQKPTGHWKKHKTTLVRGGVEEVIAITWKIDGRRTPLEDLHQGVSDDLNMLNRTVKMLRDMADQHKGKPSPEFAGLKEQLQNVERNLAIARDYQAKLNSKPIEYDDEPITRVHFPNNFHWKQDLPWLKYAQKNSQDEDSFSLSIKSQRHQVASAPAWKACVGEIKLDNGQIATVTPLNAETSDEDLLEEVEEGDTVLLAGGFVIVFGRAKNVDGDAYKAINFLKLSALTMPTTTSSRRRREEQDSGSAMQVTELI